MIEESLLNGCFTPIHHPNYSVTSVSRLKLLDELILNSNLHTLKLRETIHKLQAFNLIYSSSTKIDLKSHKVC